jgi:hypothetical protein
MSKFNILFITENKHKKQDYENIMALYGMKIKVEKNLDTLSLDEQNSLDFIIREKSNLYDNDGQIITDYTKLMLCKNISKLEVEDVKNKVTQHYVSEVSGYINPNLRTQEASMKWFGFDDCFVLSTTGISYKESALRGLKVTARHNVMSQFIKNHIKPKEIKVHNYSKTNIVKPFDMDNSVAYFLIHNAVVKQCFREKNEATELMQSIIANILEKGVFFRSSSSTRESNYWFPGLNGGIPVVPKKDEIHELTFMMHDIMHHASPDLIFDGNSSNEARMVYMMHRMMGEAISMVLADYLFVDLMKQSGIDYDYEKRKIHPVFDYLINHLPKELSFSEKIKTICYQNVLYALTGKALDVPDEIRLPYEEKYVKYFIADYVWTDRNFRNIVETDKQTQIFSQWSHQIEHQKIDTMLMTEMIQAIQDRDNVNSNHNFDMNQTMSSLEMADLVKAIFEHTWQHFIEPKMQKKTFTELSLQTPYNAFRRYMFGQSFMFFKYGHIPGFKDVGYAIIKALKNEESIDSINDLFHFYVSKMKTEHIISEEEANTFKNVFPIFDPFFVYYDRKEQPYYHIKDVVKALFNLN